MSLQSGDMIGAYRIEEVIGQGGMATVYRAHHERLARDVAIKIMHSAFLSDETFLARFSREARIVARLDHPNIVPIFDYDEYNGLPYLVMRYISGPTLKRKSFKAGLTLQETADLLGQVATGLDYAHSQGVLHRDMKPSNILIENDGRVYITDFGLARIAQAGESTISHDMMLGTPFYISPEQAQGERALTQHTDVYSLGIILYELVTGHVPFAGDTPYAIVHGHIYTPPPSPLVYNSSLPEGVEAVLLKSLAKKPQERYDSAGALMRAFSAAIAQADVSTPISVMTAKPPEKAAPPKSAQEPAHQPPAVSLPPATTGQPQRTRKRDGRQMQVESSFDLGNIDISNVDWTQLGNRINSGIRSFAELIEERIDSELHDRNSVQAEEERIRRKVRQRLKARQEFIAHLTTYLSIMALLFGIWLFTSGPFSFPWPFIPALGWGIGIVAHGMDYYSKHGTGVQRREDEIEREVAREMGRSEMPAKAKHNTSAQRGSARRQEAQQRRETRRDRRARLVDEPPQVRLNADGELTDSFIEESDQYQ